VSLYHIVFLWLILCAVLEHISQKTPKILFALSFLVLSAMLCLRFGQGTDYFSYSAIYYTVPGNPLQALTAPVHAEVGWKILCSFFRAADASFPVFIFFLSVYMMTMLLRFLKHFGGERKMLILLLCFHTLYMSYFMSILRQAVIIATLLGLLLPWLLQKKYLRFCIVALALSSLHSIALLLLLLPLLRGVQLKVKQCVALVILGFAAGAAFCVVDIASILNRIKEHAYFIDASISIVAIAERIFTFAVVTFVYYQHLQGKEPDQDDPLHIVYKTYAIGLFLYGVLMWSALISSRTVYIFKVVEICLLSICLTSCKKSRHLVLLYFIALSALLYVKNINSYLEQGAYTNANVINYPYVSVFDQTDILNYRSDLNNYPFP